MKTTLHKAFILIWCTLLRGYAYSQTDTTELNNLSLKELLNVKITTASKTSQSAELASAFVIVVTKEQIRLRNYQSLLDVMYDLRDVKVDDKMYSGMRNSFTIRGLQGSEKFVILLDGINISSSSGEAMPIMENYPVHLAEQIEILYGPSSALYGANAVSGIINIITKKNKKDFSAEASSTGGNYGYTNTTLLLTKKLDRNSSLVIGGQYFYDRGPDFSKLYSKDSMSSVAGYASGTINSVYGAFTPSTPMHAAYQAPMKAYNVYVGLHAGGFNFSFFRNDFTIPTAWGSNTLNAIFNKEVNMRQSITVTNGSYQWNLGHIKTTTSLGSSIYDLNPHSNYRNLYTSMEPAYKYSTCSMFKGEEQIDYEMSKELSMTAGAGVELYNAVPQSTDLASPVNTNGAIRGTSLGTNAYYRPDGLDAQFYFIRYNNTGAYLQLQYAPGDKIHITAGARYDHNSRYGGSFNPRMGIVYQPAPATTIKLLYGSAFRAPSPSDAYSQYGSFVTTDSGRTYRSYFLHLPNPALKPIISRTAELNIQQRISDNFFFSADAYYTSLSGLYAFSDDNATTHLYNNMFNGIPVDYIEVFTNNNRQRVYGGSLQLNWKKSLGDVQVNSWASLSLVGGRNESGLKESLQTAKDMELEFISPVMIHAGADIKTERFSISPRVIFMGRQHIAGISDSLSRVMKRQTLPGYILLNIALRYALSNQWSVFANVSNALNQRYRSVSFNMDYNNQTLGLYNGQPQDPIRFQAGLSFTFK